MTSLAVHILAADMMHYSSSIHVDVMQYWSDFTLDKKPNSYLRPAIFTFSGPAFQGLSPLTCAATTLSNLASQLFILDPVYGVLRSLDGIQPYRLEMGCKGVLESEGGGKGKKDTLASFWKESVTTYLGRALAATSDGSSDESPILANLASEEYSSSIDISSLPRNTIFLNVVFRHQGRVLAVHAKRARGLMARYLAENSSKTLEDVSKFDLEGYGCIEVDGSGCWETIDTVGDNVRVVKMTFDRSEAPNTMKAGTKTKRAGGDDKKSKRKRS